MSIFLRIYIYIYSKDGNLYHNAGYDALVTGKIFLKTAHLYAFTKYLKLLIEKILNFRCPSTNSNKMPWSFSKLLIVLRARIVNRIPIPLIDNQHCNLV